jgi:hypothetical protein
MIIFKVLENYDRKITNDNKYKISQIKVKAKNDY